jgi:Prp8 binding protein
MPPKKKRSRSKTPEKEDGKAVVVAARERENKKQKTSKNDEETESRNVLVPSTSLKSTVGTIAQGKRYASGRASSLQAPIVLLEGHEGAVNDVAFSTDGKLIATGGNDQCVRLWSFDFGKEEEEVGAGERREVSPATIANGSILRGHKNAVLSLAFLSDQFTIASASADKTIRVWDVEYGVQVKKYDKSHSRAINCASANERGTSLIVSASDDGYSKVFDVRVAKKEVMRLKHKFPVVSCAVRQDGLECATSGADGIVRTWDLRNATKYHDTAKEEDRAQLTKDLLSLDTKMTTLTMKNGHADIVTGLAYSQPDGFELASVGMDGKCNLFDLKPFRENAETRIEKTYKGVQTDFEKRVIKCATSSPSISSNASSKPTYVSSGSACGNVFVWDQKSGKIKYKLPGHKGSCLSVAFHPFEPILASAGADGKVFLGELAL